MGILIAIIVVLLVVLGSVLFKDQNDDSANNDNEQVVDNNNADDVNDVREKIVLVSTSCTGDEDDLEAYIDNDNNIVLSQGSKSKIIGTVNAKYLYSETFLECAGVTLFYITNDNVLYNIGYPNFEVERTAEKLIEDKVTKFISNVDDHDGYIKVLLENGQEKEIQFAKSAMAE